MGECERGECNTPSACREHEECLARDRKETVPDVAREMAAIPFHSEVYGETVQDFAARIEAANAREVEANDAYIREADRRISVLASLLNQANVDRLREVEALQLALDNEQAKGVHTCSIYFERPLCVARREIESLRQRVEAAEAAGRRVIAAFEAHGKANGVGDDLSTRAECEHAMVALDAAISAGRV